MAKIKKYYIDMDSDVTAISLVEEGAIMSDFIALAKQSPKQVYLEREEKHMVVGAILIPDRPIYRYDEEMGEYYITFSSKVIEKLAYDYMKNKLTDSVTLDHETDAQNITLVESWIKTSDNDKSTELGLDAPIGSWLGAMKVEDEETWRRIKNQELNGFSVEAFCNLSEFKLSIEDMNKEEKSFLEEIKEIIKEALSVVAKPEEKEVEAEVEQEVELEKTEEVEVEEPKAEEVELEKVEEPEAEVEQEVELEKTEEVELESVDDLKAVIDKLQAEIEALKAENEELKSKNEKLAKQPSVNKVNVEASAERSTPSFLDFASGRVKY